VEATGDLEALSDFAQLFAVVPRYSKPPARVRLRFHRELV
jgi:hypothetical protein